MITLARRFGFPRELPSMGMDRTMVIVLLLLGTSRDIRADTIFSDFGPGGSYAASNYGLSTSQTVANAFTPTADYTLGQIDLGLTHFSGTNAVDVDLRNDSSGAPGSLIESWTLTSLPAYGSTLDTAETVTAVGTAFLLQGTQYWLQVSTGDSTTIAAWMQNDQNVIGSVYFTRFGTVTNVLSAFDVLGTPSSTVPEPGLELPTEVCILGALWYLWLKPISPVRAIHPEISPCAARIRSRETGVECS